IDYALCMYCGICVEVCPYDALFWSREFEYAEYDIRELTHEKERLSDWMATVLPPPELEVGAELPGQSSLAAAEPAAVPPTPTAAAPAPAAPAPAAPAPAAPAPAAPPAEKPKTETAPEPAPPAAVEAKAPETPAPEPEAPEESPLPQSAQVTVPTEVPKPVALERTEDPQTVYEQVLQEQLDKGSSPQVAEARAKVARVKAERGIKRGPTPVEVDKPVPSAPTEGEGS
ncbi:MAG TPA: 4Fe-4S binding protein, partial [Actinomycetota bacterium]|nr:4Fe-4S binding protein [Actinomycetota bacterium]